MSDAIIRAVEATLKDLETAFAKSPTFFYTENDLVCWFVAELIPRLPDRGVSRDVEGQLHRLVHTEYPTPFRCKMDDGSFSIREDHERTQAGGGYSRGHFDIVILNPEFVARHNYQQLKAQNYHVFRQDVWDARVQGEAMLLYAIEFYFSRDPIPSLSAVDRCVQAIVQDADKLVGAKSLAYEGFVSKVQHMAFLKGASAAMNTEIQGRLAGRSDILLVCAPCCSASPLAGS